jgi:FxsC-like protein
MGHDFFFSYTRADNDGSLQKFFKELNAAVRSKAGYPAGFRAGYFDQERLRRGEEWNEALVDALQECSSLVCLYSPAYFKSEFCGREWGFFDARRRLYREQQRAAGRPAAASPPVIKPVLWVPLTEALPAGIDMKQFTEGDPHAVVNREGLLYVRQRYDDYKRQYRDFVDDLAKEIVAARELRTSLPQLPGALDLASVPNAFQEPPARAAAPAPVPRQQGPNAVLFVFIAGKPEEFQPGTRLTASYHERGGRDWKPYFPHQSKPIGALAQTIAAGELDLYSQELPVNDALPAAVRAAEEQANIVVLVVDGWTTKLPSYQRILQEFDKHGFFNCSVLVPWNDADAETLQERAALAGHVRTVLLRQSRNQRYFRDAIGSEEQLKSTLRDVLILLRSEIFNQAPVTRPVPSGEAKPAITGPGTQQVPAGAAP